MKLSTTILAMMVALEHTKKRKRKRRTVEQHSRYRKNFYLMLSDDSKRVQQRRLPRVSLLSPRKSPWSKLYKSQNDQGMITLTGFDYNSFNVVNEKFTSIINEYTPFQKSDNTITLKRSRRGRKRVIDAVDCLGLVLAWTRTRGSMAVLQIIFGLTMTNLSTYL